MPKILLTVPGTKESVTRPVVLEITRQLMEITGISNKTQIMFPGDVEKIAQVGSTITKEGDPNLTPFNERISIEVEEAFEMERLLSTAVFRPENQHVFRDDAIETFIRPVYSSQDMTLNFKYRAVDRAQAIRWVEDIRARVAMMRDQRLHSLSYHFLIPEEMIVILKELHRMREATAPYGDSWETYFSNHVSPYASLLTTLAGTQPAWAISETQARIVGWFDFEGVPERGDKDDDGDTWTIAFSYKFKFDKPIACTMGYPLMVHNQLIDQKYRPDEPSYMLGHRKLQYSLSAACFAEFELGNKVLGISQGVAIPSFDEFLPSSVITNTVRMFTALTNIDFEDPQYLLSLKELGDYEIHPVILNFMKGELQFMPKTYQSVFTLSLYEGPDLLSNAAVVVDSNFKVFATKTLDARKYYHVRLGLVSDFDLLSQAALERLRNSGPALWLILEALGYKWDLPKLIGDYVTRDEMNLVLERIALLNRIVGNGQAIQFNTVQTLFIQTERLTDANR